MQRSTPSVKQSFRKSSLLIAAAAGLGLATPVLADAVYWDGSAGSGNWGLTNNWSTSSTTANVEPASGFVPDNDDDVTFNVSAITAGQTINLLGDRGANSITFRNSGGATLQGSTGADVERTLTVGAGGFTIADTVGNGFITIGNTAANQSIKLVGSSFFDKLNSGTLRIRANNSGFNGAFNIKAGIVEVGTHASGLGSGTVTIGDSVVGANARLQVSSLTLANNIVVAAGAGTRTIANWPGQSPTYSGNISLNNDVLITSDAFLRLTGGMSGAGNVTLVTTGSTNGLQFGNAAPVQGGLVDFDGTISVSSSSLATSPVIFQGSTSLGSKVTDLYHAGANYLTLASANPNFIGNVTTYTSGGIFRIENAQAIGSSTTVTLATGTTFEIYNVMANAAGLNGASGASVSLSSNSTDRTLTLSGASGAFSYAGNLTSASPTGKLALTKTGNSTQTLSGNYNYAGVTQVNGGTLRVTGAHTGAGAYTVNTGGTLGGGGTGTHIATASNAGVTVLAGGKLAPGATAGGVSTLRMNLGTGQLNLTGAVTAAASQSMLFDLTTGGTDRIELAAGALNIGSNVLQFDDFVFSGGAGLTVGEYTLIDTSAAIVGTLAETGLSGSFDGYGGTIALSNDGQDLMLNVTSVPEPTSMSLLGLAGLGLLKRRRRCN